MVDVNPEYAKRITVAVSEDVHRRFKLAATARGLTISAAVRQLLSEFSDECLDALSQNIQSEAASADTPTASSSP